MISEKSISSGEDLVSLINEQKFAAVFGSNGHDFGFEDQIFLGAQRQFRDSENLFNDLEKLVGTSASNSYAFIDYDTKNQIESLSSHNPDQINFALNFCVEPELWITKSIPSHSSRSPFTYESIEPSISKEDYLDRVNTIRQLIKSGEVYEINFCIPFQIKEIDLNPLDLYQRLIKLSGNPYSCYMRNQESHIISASPERFLSLKDGIVTAQPMKGTSQRSENRIDDLKSRDRLYQSEKERAENLMIVDLMRNDLSRTAVPGSVKVENLFEIQSFSKVHQMISTIRSHKADQYSFSDVIKNAFPMGSMTGAPKIRAMEVIEELESFKRGPFSGSVGIFSPNEEFELNVLIRSIFYNSETKSLFFATGSAITYDSNPEDEWNECLLKASAIIESLSR